MVWSILIQPRTLGEEAYWLNRRPESSLPDTAELLYEKSRLEDWTHEKHFIIPFHRVDTKLKELFVHRRSRRQQQQQQQQHHDDIWSSEVRLMLWGEDSHLEEDDGVKYKKATPVLSEQRQEVRAPAAPVVHRVPDNNLRARTHTFKQILHYTPEHTLSNVAYGVWTPSVSSHDNLNSAVDS